VGLSQKQDQFNKAMQRYNSGCSYKLFNMFVSASNISLQIYLLFRIWSVSVGMLWQTVIIIFTFLFTDFLNGLVHMYMDNNDRYDTPAGPLVANFHLHHKIPQYQKRNLLLVYFNETGSKVWLIGYLAAVAILAGFPGLNPKILLALVYTGILSSFAEVSHYLCHSSTSGAVLFLSRTGILLSKKHHAAHHLSDNINYAFLNGFSDPLLNLIARKLCKGYKNTTDQHFANYVPTVSESR
jgi:Lipid desaturase domain